MIRLALSHKDLLELGIQKKSDRDTVRRDMYEQVRKNSLSNNPSALTHYVRAEWLPKFSVKTKGLRYGQDIIDAIVLYGSKNYTPKRIMEITGVSIPHIRRILNRVETGMAYGYKDEKSIRKIESIKDTMLDVYNHKKESSNDPKYSWTKFYEGDTTLLRYHQWLFGSDKKVFTKLLKWYDEHHSTNFLPKSHKLF